MAEPAWHGIIDCAQDQRLIEVVRASPSHLCLFKGRTLAPAVEATAPWLVRLEPGGQVQTLWQRHGREANWGIMVYSDATIETLQRHFRRFLQAMLPDGTIALFRFYDPRIFNVYMRAATPQERAPWFTCVEQYSVEPAGETVHNFRLHEDRLYDGGQCLD